MGLPSFVASGENNSSGLDEQIVTPENRDARREFLIRQITGMLDMVEHEFGNPGLELIAKRAQGELSGEDLRAELEVAPDFQEFQAGALEFFESRGFIEYDGDILVANIDKIKKCTLAFPGERQAFGKKPEDEFLKKFEVFHENSTLKFLFAAFQGRKVMDKEEWDKYNQGKLDYEPQVMDVFYSPQSIEAAFDVEQIQTAEFHLGPWELHVGGIEEDVYPGALEKIPFFEASIACKLYHPAYGDAERNLRGSLLLRGETGSFEKINRDIFARFKSRGPNEKELYETPRKFLLDGGFPHLQKAGLLKPGDFRSLSTNTESKYDLHRDITHPKGSIMLEGIRYTLGSEYAPTRNETYRVYKVSDRTGGIVRVDNATQAEALVGMFDLLSDDPNHELRTKDRKVSYIDVGKMWANVRGYPPSDFEKDAFGDENFEAGKDFSTFIEARQKLHKESGVDIMGLTPEEQGRFIQFLQKETKAPEKFYQFAKQFGLDGIRSFFATTQEAEAKSKIFSIGERYSLPQAAAIFEKYTEFLDATALIEDELSGFISKDVDRKKLSEIVTEKLLHRAGEILTKYAGEKEQPEKIKDFLQELERFESEVLLFGTLFKNIYKGKEKIDLNEVRQFEFSSQHPRDIDERDKHRMMEVIIQNMKSEGEYGKTLVANLRRALSDESDEVNFYLLKKKGEVVAYVRFYQQHDQYGAPIPGRKGGGSFNVASDEQGYAFGEAMLLNAIKSESEKNIVDAFVDPAISIGTRYVEDVGCDISGIIDVGGKKVFKLLCSGAHTEKSFSRREDKTTIMDEYKRNHISVEDLMKQNASRIVCRFDSTRDEQHILLTTQKLCANEYRGVRYFEDPEDKKLRYYVFELDEQRREERLRRSLQL